MVPCHSGNKKNAKPQGSWWYAKPQGHNAEWHRSKHWQPMHCPNAIFFSWQCIFAVDLIWQKHFGIALALVMDDWYKDVLGGYKAQALVNVTSGKLLGFHSWMCQTFTKVVKTSWICKCIWISATPMVPLVWYSTTSPLQHWVWFTLAHKLLWAFAMGSPNNLAKVCKVALLAGLLESKYSPSLNTSCWSSLQISWERTCSSKLVSKFWVFCKACAKAPIGLCFLSLAKHDTNLPNLWWVSPMWNCQCHFLINGMSGQACWKVVMAFSAACTRVSLLMRFAKLPSWTWSIKLAMASRAAQALGWCFCGLATECTKCLTTGNKAKHSLAWQLILWLFLWLATFFFWKKVPRCGVLEFFGNATKGKIFQKLPDAEVFFHGTKKMVKANRCCALEDPMHWVVGKLAAWFQ